MHDYGSYLRIELSLFSYSLINEYGLEFQNSRDYDSDLNSDDHIASRILGDILMTRSI